MSAEEKSMILEQIAKMAEADKAFVTGWAAGRLSMVKPKEEKGEAQGRKAGGRKRKDLPREIRRIG